MRLGEGVEWALHCCGVLATVPPGHVLPAKALAEYHAVPPAYLAKQLQALAAAGIVETTPGRTGGYRLARPATQISLLDVVEAVEGRGPAFRCTEIRQQGPCVGPPETYRHMCGIQRRMLAAEAAWRAKLASETIADVVIELAGEHDPDVASTALVWLGERVR
jgi:Rrf2 family protein